MKNPLSLVKGILYGVTLILFAIAGYFVYRNIYFSRSGKTVQGRVIRLAMQRSSTGTSYSTSYYPVITFTTENNRRFTFRSSIGFNPPRHRIGDTVKVQYDPKDPADARIGDFVGQWLVSIILGGVGLLMFFITLMAGKAARRMQKTGLPQSGQIGPGMRY